MSDFQGEKKRGENVNRNAEIHKRYSRHKNQLKKKAEENLRASTSVFHDRREAIKI
jgi:hypothetical protein